VLLICFIAVLIKIKQALNSPDNKPTRSLAVIQPNMIEQRGKKYYDEE
jgi:hypothetical protein